MQHLLKRLFEPQINGPEIALLLAQTLDVQISESTIKKELEEHPDYPSLLSISDVLTAYGIGNLTAKINSDQLVNAPVPFITQIKGKKQAINFFTVVKKITAESVCFFDPEKHLWDMCSMNDFSTRSSSIILLTEVQNNAGEKKYIQKINSENVSEMHKILWHFGYLL